MRKTGQSEAAEAKTSVVALLEAHLATARAGSCDRVYLGWARHNRERVRFLAIAVAAVRRAKLRGGE